MKGFGTELCVCGSLVIGAVLVAWTILIVVNSFHVTTPVPHLETHETLIYDSHEHEGSVHEFVLQSGIRCVSVLGYNAVSVTCDWNRQ